MPKVKTTITIEPEQMEALKALSNQWQIDVSVIMRYALAEFLRRPAIFSPVGATLSSDKRDSETLVAQA